MMTVLTDIEAIIKSRPLTYVCDGDEIWEIRLMYHHGKQKFLSRSALGTSIDFKVIFGLVGYVNICQV